MRREWLAIFPEFDSLFGIPPIILNKWFERKFVGKMVLLGYCRIFALCMLLFMFVCDIYTMLFHVNKMHLKTVMDISLWQLTFVLNLNKF